MAKQYGFGFAALDPVTGEEVPWAKYDKKTAAEIFNAPWKVVDTETTGLTPASVPVSLTGKEVRTGGDNTTRLRVITVRYPVEGGGTQLVAYDADYLRTVPNALSSISGAALNGVFIAQNAGFDMYWLMEETSVEPKLIMDTMLLARVLAPDLPVRMAVLAGEYNPSDVDAITSPDPFVKAAFDAVMGEKSGWALAELSLMLLNRLLPKAYQGPKNWAVEVLGHEHYQYATSDVDVTYEILWKLLKVDEHGGDLFTAYKAARKLHPEIRDLEPQVPDLVQMRRHGVPIKQEQAKRYAAAQYGKAALTAFELGELDETLKPFVSAFADPNQGLSASAKLALAAAFERRGIVLRTTENTGTPMVGEKDLRLAGAQTSDEARPLFEAWVKTAKCKKTAQMALDWANFAKRSKDGRIHPLLGHGPVTGRLSSADPNTQQAPRDQDFRAMVEAEDGKLILADDYSALDMRVGAALAIRAQREIMEAYEGRRAVDDRTLAAIRYAVDTEFAVADPALALRIGSLEAQVEKLKSKKDEMAVKQYWNQMRKLTPDLLLTRFCARLVEVRQKAKLSGQPEYSALRDAFQLGVDIHTFTAMGMQGVNAMQEFAGRIGEALEEIQKAWKKKLGDKRQHGKIGNLSLLYAMQARGLQEAAGKIYNVHWTLEESAAIRSLWLDAYPEVDLWHAWTELNPAESIWMPDSDRGGRRTRKDVHLCVTLGGRKIYAFGLNAALAFQDQSTGADILGKVMHKLRVEHPEVFKCAINQVHDELVLEIPEMYQVEYTDIVSTVMDDCANELLMPYGVPSACSPAIGKIWIKD